MRIAFVTYEYPPETGLGGIATYVYQIAHAFSKREIYVHVVCGSPHASLDVTENGHLIIHRIKANGRADFITKSPATLASIHKQNSLDLIEAPDYGAESLHIKEKLPHITLLVKLHTPAYLVKRLNDYYYDKRIDRKIKYLFANYKPQQDDDYQAAIKADYLLAPSKSIAEIISRDWKIDKEKIIHAPNPYLANENLAAISSNRNNKTVLYIGRLETRKGVYNLSKAIPLVLKQIPEAHFIFLGRDDRGPHRERSMKEVLYKEIGSHKDKVQFVEQVSLFEIPEFLEEASVCVFPSLWENFPNVCLEAMTAATAVVASKNGGMQEMLSPIKGARLVDPFDVEEIAEAVVYLLRNDEERHSYAEESRERIASYYSGQLIDELTALYHNLAAGTL